MALFVKTNEQYGDGIILDEYQGTFSLINAKLLTDGQINERWFRAQTCRPRVRLGGREQAITALREFVAELEKG